MNKKLKKEIKKNKIEKVEKGEMVNKTTKKLDNDKSKPQPEKKLSRKSILLLVGGGILIVILIGAGVAISNTKQKEEKIIAVRLAAATRINQVWQEKQVDDKINGKNLGEVLGAN
jgi:uncharacterized protein HemX